MSRRPALSATATSKTPLSFLDQGQSWLHSLMLELSKMSCFRKVLSLQTMSILQEPRYRKVLGTVVSSSPEDQIARKGLLTPKSVLRVRKMKHVPASQPRGKEVGVLLWYSGEVGSRWTLYLDLRSEYMKWSGRKLTFQGSTPGSTLGGDPCFHPLECNVC